VAWLTTIRSILSAIDRAAQVLSIQKRNELAEFLCAILDDLQIDGAKTKQAEFDSVEAELKAIFKRSLARAARSRRAR
jgi:hypothetical protein